MSKIVKETTLLIIFRTNDKQIQQDRINALEVLLSHNIWMDSVSHERIDDYSFDINLNIKSEIGQTGYKDLVDEIYFLRIPWGYDILYGS